MWRLLTFTRKLIQRHKIKLMFRHFFIESYSFNDDRVITIEKFNNEFLITTNDESQSSVASYSDVLAKITEEFFYPTLFSNQDYLYLHGGAVEKDNVSICYLAPSNVGKTTLTVDFIKNGYTYLTDDIISINLSDYTTKGFPKPLFLRLDSIHKPNCDIYIKNGEFERNVYIPKDCCSHSINVQYIFVLNRDKINKNTCNIKKIENNDKFMSLLNNIYYTPDKMHMIKSLAGLIRNVKLYEVFYNTSDQAISCMKSVFESH
jgi:hypothetical protein